MNSPDPVIKKIESEINQTNDTEKKYVVRTAAELQGMDIKPPEFLVNGFLPKSGTLVVSGSPKVGKTSLVFSLLFQLSKGLKVFDVIDIEQPYKTLFLALEDNDQRMTRRFEDISGPKHNNNGTWPEGFSYITSFPCTEQSRLDQLEEAIKKHDPDVIVIDTLEKFFPREGEGYSKDYKRGTKLADFANKVGKIFIFIHHNRKAASENPIDQVSGTYGLVGSIDNVWIMNRTGKMLTIIVTGRDLIEEKYEFKQDPDTSSWQLEGKFHVEAKSKEQNNAINILKKYGEMKAKVFAEFAKIKTGTARVQLSRMHKNKLIGKEGKKYHAL